MTTTGAKKGEANCPSPGGDASFQIDVKTTPGVVDDSHGFQGIYVQTITSHWFICAGCPDPYSVYDPLQEVYIFHFPQTACTSHQASFTEWRIVQGSGPDMKLVDHFGLSGTPDSGASSQIADSKRFVGSGAPGFFALYLDLEKASETVSVTVTHNGKKTRANAIEIDTLPSPPTEGVIVVFGSDAAVDTPSTLDTFLTDPANAPFIVGGNPHSALLGWNCCPDINTTAFSISY